MLSELYPLMRMNIACISWQIDRIRRLPSINEQCRISVLCSTRYRAKAVAKWPSPVLHETHYTPKTIISFTNRILVKMVPRPRYFTATHATYFEQRHNLHEGSVAAAYLARFGATDAKLALEDLVTNPPLLTGPDGAPRWATNAKEQDIVDERHAEGFQDNQGKWHPPFSSMNVPSPRSKVKRSGAVKDKSGSGAQGIAGVSGVKRSGAMKGDTGLLRHSGTRRGGGVEKRGTPRSKRPSRDRSDSAIGGVAHLDSDFTSGRALRKGPRSQRSSDDI
ncbi:hypothetical protein DOTSEDRAFT_34936 [Dothistroma septosporum NZE10]|uniref:Uncharacterized protein n=1 Tax=Dothistroma septosporum (strain NZE10 / CBS 128990) TaxID=675120 RepID=N1PQ24_DOTSN|nr:hypothetical protein DOTSEDRAFT_34936 [Dothistroma septosporum NZE10]